MQQHTVSIPYAIRSIVSSLREQQQHYRQKHNADMAITLEEPLTLFQYVQIIFKMDNVNKFRETSRSKPTGTTSLCSQEMLYESQVPTKSLIDTLHSYIVVPYHYSHLNNYKLHQSMYQNALTRIKNDHQGNEIFGCGEEKLVCQLERIGSQHESLESIIDGIISTIVHRRCRLVHPCKRNHKSWMKGNDNVLSMGYVLMSSPSRRRHLPGDGDKSLVAEASSCKNMIPGVECKHANTTVSFLKSSITIRDLHTFLGDNIFR